MRTVMLASVRRAAPVLAVLVLAATAGSVAAGAQEAPLLYVCNQEGASVSVIDTHKGKVVRTLDLTALGYSAGAKPHHIAVEPDGSYWYLSLIGDGKVLKLDRDDRVVVEAPFETPGMLAVHPTDDLLFLGRSMTAVNPPPRIGIIRRADMDVEEIDVLHPRPHAIALDSSGQWLYTASLGENQIMTLHVPTGEVAFHAVEGPHHVLAHAALSPDGSHLAISAEHTGRLLVFDVSRPPSPARVAEIEVGARPWHLIFSPDGRHLYFGNQGANTVTVVDARTWEVEAVIEGDGLAEPHGVVLSPDGRRLYVSNRNLKGEWHGDGYRSRAANPPGNVVIIDTATRQIERVIAVGQGPSGVALLPPR